MKEVRTTREGMHGRKKKKSLLVVDDNDLICWAFQKFMKDTPYQVTTARDGRKAMEMIDNEHFDLVITDLNMPGSSGIEVIAKAKKNLPESKLVLMTAHASLLERENATKAGADMIIDKPFQLKAILALLENLLFQH